MSIREIQAIDVHAHYGPYRHEGSDHSAWLMSGDAGVVAQRARAARTEWTIVSPLLGLLPRGKASAAQGNDEAAAIVPQTPGLLQYVIVNPLEPATYDQARRMLREKTCVGIKLHPEEHRYPIRDHGDALFAFAAEHKAVVLVHSGEQLSLPDDYADFANAYPEMKLILAHIGCAWNGDRTLQVRGIQKSRHGNIYADTSSAMSILPRLIEWAVGEVGVDRILYGTDTPLYLAAMQRARIDDAELPDADKKLILRDNAVRLFGEKLAPFVAAAATVAKR